MIANNKLLLEVMRLAKLKTDHRGNNYLRNPYHLPRNVTMSANTVLRDICFELIQKRLKRELYKGYVGELRESMIANAFWQLQHYWHKFNPKKSDNPIGYFNVCIDSSFIGAICDFKRKAE